MTDDTSRPSAASRHIVLTSHPRPNRPKPPRITWGAKTGPERGAIIGTLGDPARRNVIGAHAGSYALYRALAVAAGSLSAVHRPDLTDTLPAEMVGPHPQWMEPAKIVSLDPWGHVVGEAFADRLVEGWDIRPTIAVTKARLTVPELRHAVRLDDLPADGRIVNEKGEVNCTKVAVDPVWYLPGVAARCGVSETDLRRHLFEQTGGMFPELVTRPDLHVFLPPIGGQTAYIFGELAALTDPKRELACRVHDECNGSDVFGSDICTCRPYLVHGIEVCIETAQSGGAGVIVYNRKEGRGLGEVTKFLVYNARKRQAGGDRASAYFARTECVAGVQDVRFQELMPDVLHWLGITRIEKFVSMSNMKYDALIRQGIEIVQRVPIPDDRIPEDARVEMDAKKAAGYFSEAQPSAEDLALAKGARAGRLRTAVSDSPEVARTPAEAIARLFTPDAVRERCGLVLAAARRGELEHFALDEAHVDPAADYVIQTIRAAYPDLAVPYHSRWRHFAAGGRDRWGALAAGLHAVPAAELARIRCDLVVVSVLLDAGAGAAWRYLEPTTGDTYVRSEGLALASFHAFARGLFSARADEPLRADAKALATLDTLALGEAFQVRPDNPLLGLEGRVLLMNRLGATLGQRPDLFGQAARVGHLLDWLAAAQARNGRLPVRAVLAAVLDGLGPIWPGRIEIDGINLGDVGRHPAARAADLTDRLVPFHKLSQWLAYSLIEPLEQAGIRVMGLDELTALAEYRNGGLLIDLGVLRPRHAGVLGEAHLPASEVVVEWRALTVALLDLLADRIRARLGLSPVELPLAKVLEGGTWSAGRRIAGERRPDGSPPLRLISDGTLF